MTDEATRDKRGDLSVTALYTSATWSWGGLSGAELLASDEARRVFGATNAALGAAGLLMPEIGSLRHSLLHRHAMIDHLLRDAGAVQVLELAAGLSRRGVAFSADPAVRYTEVDLPPVVARKRALLERTAAGREVLARPNLRLVAADVQQAPLAGLVEGEPGAPFVIAEGLLVYLEPDAQRALFAKVRALLGKAAGAAFVFDLVPRGEEPPPGAVGKALEWSMKRFTGGRSFAKDTRTRTDIVADLRAAGFSSVDPIGSQAVAHTWDLPFPDVPSRQLVFVARG